MSGLRVLLDTHVLLWLVDDTSKLSSRVTQLCEDENNALFVSVASFWELAIKMSLGKIALADHAIEQLKSWCLDNTISILPIDIDHCIRVQTLPFHHRDPFDRLLIAQALCEELTMISVDEHFPAYGVEVIPLPTT